MSGMKPTKSSKGTVSLLLALAVSILIGLYPHIRYNGHLSGGGDAGRFAVWIASMQSQMTILTSGGTYGNGYGYQALVVLSNHITGLDLGVFQTYLGTLLIVWTVFVAWLFYREITQSNLATGLAMFILLAQPELLFALLRGTHEKFSRGLMFLCLYLLVRSILARRQLRLFVSFLLAFYLAGYALISFNNLLAISFIAALALALALSLFIRQLNRARPDNNSATRRRLLYAVLILLVLAFIFTFYAYPPARKGIVIAESATDRLALLFLDVEEATENPYQTISTSWISLPVYLLVSIANWLLLAISFMLWSAQSHSWWRCHTWPDEPRDLLLWSLYGSFGFLGALSIAVDVSGAMSARNIQHRVFPSFAMIAAPVVANWVVRRQEFRPVARRLVYGMLVAGIALLSLVALAKSSNEPLLSNKWSFYSPNEFKAVDWTLTTNPNAPTWISYDERLRAAIHNCCPWEVEETLLDAWRPEPGTRNYLMSNVIRARAKRSNLSLPIEGDSLRVYDNGSAEIYRLRPRTPFQK